MKDPNNQDTGNPYWGEASQNTPPQNQAVTASSPTLSANQPVNSSMESTPPQTTGNPYWGDPGQNASDVTAAQQQLGSQKDNGFCERFVEQEAYGHTGIFPSAIDAFKYYSDKGIAQSDFTQMKPGDLIYYSANQSNGNEGHVGIYQGNGQMISATDNGVQATDIKQWMSATGQKPLGFVPPR